MSTRFNFLIRYFLFWLIYFLFARIFFMAYQFQQTIDVSIGDWVGILVRGLWMDTSLAGYILLLTGLIIVLLNFTSNSLFRGTIYATTALLLGILTLIVVADAELYRNWGYRIDATPLLYLKTPEEAAASVKTYMIIILLAVSVLIFIGFFYFFKKIILPKHTVIEKGKWWFLPVFLFFSALMIIPIRGGFGIAPMNTGKVYFSQNVFSNHAALNATWNMMYSISKSKAMYKKYPDYIEKEKAQSIFHELMKSDQESVRVLNTTRPNIVILLLESFSSKLIEPLGGKPGITPNFNRLCQEGILFSRLIASGDRSDKGIIAVVSGFPAQSTQSIIKYPLKSQKLPTISGILNDSGYHTAFYYGGDPDFANIRSYLFSAKFRRIITQDDFPRAFRNSKWGVHDEFVFNRLLADIDSAKTPFLKMFFTLTSHEPFDIPTRPRFKGNSEDIAYSNSAYYADSCLGDFINKARTREWYKNTLFILIADHGTRLLGNQRNYEVERYNIPMLWIGGALAADSIKINSTGSQIDLAATMLTQMGIPTDKFLFSKDLLRLKAKGFAYYAFNDGFGFLTDSSKVIFDHISKKYISIDGINVELTKDKANAFFSVYQDVFLGL